MYDQAVIPMLDMPDHLLSDPAGIIYEWVLYSPESSFFWDVPNSPHLMSQSKHLNAVSHPSAPDREQCSSGNRDFVWHVQRKAFGDRAKVQIHIE